MKKLLPVPLIAFALGCAAGLLGSMAMPTQYDRAYHAGFHDGADAAIDYLISNRQ